MKKIALIMDGWQHHFSYAWAAGITKRIRETEEDVNLYMFNSFGDWGKGEDYNSGEYNIYRLPHLKDFDGIILDLNNIRYPEIQADVLARVKASGVPAITIANVAEGFYYVGINNYAAIQKMIGHLYTTHHCRKFWCIMGPKDHYENRQRAMGLKDFLEEKQIPYTENEFYYESFEYQCGVNGFRRMLETHEGLPDAVICANDNIAIGVCEAAAEYGYRVPEDFCVTGFDNFEKAGHYLPRISTVGHLREEVGYLCVETFLQLWAGKEVERYQYTKAEGVYWESCACKPTAHVDERLLLRNHVMYQIEAGGFNEEVLSLEYELKKCNSVQEMTQCIPKCVPSLKCDALYMILDAHIHEFKEQASLYHKRSIEDGDFYIEGYPEKMRVEFAYENGRFLETDNLSIEYIFPMFDSKEGGNDYLFLPLHFQKWTVGYVVVRNTLYLMEKQFLFQVINTFATAMENLYKKEQLEYINQVLSELYIRDSMTGMYNRLGYQRLSEQFLKEKHAKGENVLILFIDLDRMKYINDNLGHESGDFAIVSTARAIMNHAGKGAIPARIGGDEFVLVCEAKTEEELVQLKADIRKEIEEVTKKMKLPFSLGVSMGAVITKAQQGKTLDEYLKEADDNMYMEKSRKRANRQN